MTLEELNIQLPNVIAGLAGGAVNAIVFGRANLWAIMASMVVGGAVANYMADAAAKFTGMTVPTSAFIVGTCGMAIIQGIYSAVQSWRPNIPGGKSGASGGSSGGTPNV